MPPYFASEFSTFLSFSRSPPYTRPMPLLAISVPRSTAACLYSGSVPADDPQKTAMRRNGGGGGRGHAESAAVGFGAAGIVAFSFECGG